MGNLVTDIQVKLVDNQYSIMDILRIGLVIANKLEAEEIKRWIKNELSGYAKGEKLPNYRNVPMSVKFFNSVYGWCPVEIRNKEFSEMLKSMALRQSLSEIYELSRESENKEIHFEAPITVIEELSKCAPFETEFHYVCNIIYMSKIIDIVKTNLLEWVIELQANGIVDEEMNFNIESIKKSESINKSVVNHFYGDKGNINVMQNISEN